jgi:transcriptional regulator with XRE-family HTH domain
VSDLLVGPKRLMPVTLPVSHEARRVLSVLRQRRLELGLTQAQLAGQMKGAAGSQGNFSDLERGVYAPNLATLIRWYQALDFRMHFERMSREEPV